MECAKAAGRISTDKTECSCRTHIDVALKTYRRCSAAAAGAGACFNQRGVSERMITPGDQCDAGPCDVGRAGISVIAGEDNRSLCGAILELTGPADITCKGQHSDTAGGETCRVGKKLNVPVESSRLQPAERSQLQ